MGRQMKVLFLMQVQLEARKRYVLFSIVLYLISLVFVNYLALTHISIGSQPGLWSALFWMALLSVVISSIGKSFMAERPGMFIYLYYLTSPGKIILSKILYGFFLSSLVSVMGYLVFALMLANPIQDMFLFILTIILACYGFSASLTLLSGIAAKTSNGNILMAVLSFPVIIGILLMSIQITKNCIDGIDPSASYDELLTLGAINLLVSAVSYLLFPYIWRS